MAIGPTNFLMEKLLNWFLRATAWSSPGTIYLGLDSALGDANGGGTELTHSGYGRQAIAFGAYSSRRVSNSSPVSFTAGENWPEVTGFRLWDAASGGNALGWGRAVPRPTILAGQAYPVAAGECSFAWRTEARVGDWFVQRMLEKALKAQAHASLSGSLKAHLALVAPANDGSGYTMVSGSGYSPQSATFAAWASGRNYLAADIAFAAPAAADWGDVVEWDLYDGTNPASDHFLFGCPLSPTAHIGVGVNVVLKATDSYVYLEPYAAG